MVLIKIISFLIFFMFDQIKWEMWLLTWQEEGDVDQGEAELLVRTINICTGRWVSENLFSDPQYKSLFNLTNGVCHQLRLFQYHEVIYIFTYPVKFLYFKVNSR